jgi:hypothetical protein
LKSPARHRVQNDRECVCSGLTALLQWASFTVLLLLSRYAINPNPSELVVIIVNLHIHASAIQRVDARWCTPGYHNGYLEI